MRVVPFREVLWGVANKMGLDPLQSNFLDNQAIPIGDWIDQWVSRTYDARDWPEWVVTEQFTPVNHVVPWDGNTTGILTTAGARQIGRVIKVFLLNPETTNAPVDTPFTLLDNGIHVGYEHGTSVWVRYIAPAPRYTAVQWRAETTFQKDDVTYSYTTGQVYKSKSNGNLGHDPASTFSVPPIPHVIEPNPPGPAPDITTTQPRIADNVGLPERNQILVLSMSDAFTGVPLPEPPENGTTLVVQVYDPVTSTLLGDALTTGDGFKTISVLLGELVTTLSAIPALSTFTITHDYQAITLENASLFTTPASSYTILSEGGPNHIMKSVVTQTYVPAFSTASGQPQITRVSMSDSSTVPGAIYTMTVTGSDGVEHPVTYASSLYDSSSQILHGLLLAAESDTDVFWDTVQFGFDSDAATLDIAVRDTFSVNVAAPPPGSSWWELVPFPRELVNTVIRGAYADLLREWGQDAKADGQEQVVPQESDIAANDFTPLPTPPLTGQQVPVSRYKQ